MPHLSVILPFHNEHSGIRHLMERLYPALGQLDLSYEIICIDDGSTDNTFEALVHERRFDRRLKIVRFARNFGKEIALTCGLRMASGDVAITMDSDLQHPPETIPDLIAKWREGFDVVYATRRNRKTDSALRRVFSRAFYAVFRKIADIQMPEGAGDFCLLSRKAIDAVNALPERNRFMKGLTSWVGFRRATVPFDVGARDSGQSNWSFFRLLRFAFDGLSAFSTLPLRIWTWCGVLVSLGALLYALCLIVDTLIYGVDVPGYASTMVGILFLGGLQLLSLGIMGEYMARIFTEVKARPLYFVSERVGFDPAQDSGTHV
ncbi:MAG: glycosyltransferase family 2 protein [Alphaproteobacteria bacterium]|nr:glycosyltransferase family 2 protein [Alphaproteobacteria bacterium]